MLIATLLRSQGFRVVTARDAGQLRKTDADQLRYAVEQQLAILTHNRTDFEQLATEYVSHGQNHFGMLIAVRRPPQEIARRLLRILNDTTADEMVNQVLYV